MITVLVIDDNPTNGEMVRHILLRVGIETIIADDGTQGMNAFQLHRPALVIVDMMLPKNLGPDGAEIIQQIKQNPETQNTPIIALTAVSNVEVHHSALLAGCDLFMPKPFTPSELIANVQHLLEASAAD